MAQMRSGGGTKLTGPMLSARLAPAVLAPGDPLTPRILP